MMTGLLMLAAPAVLYFVAWPLSGRFRPGLRLAFRFVAALVAFPGSGMSVYLAAYTGDQGGIAAFYFQAGVIILFLLVLIIFFLLHRLWRNDTA